MAQCLMFIFHWTIIPEDIVALHMYNILNSQVANLMVLPHCCHFCVKLLLFGVAAYKGYSKSFASRYD